MLQAMSFVCLCLLVLGANASENEVTVTLKHGGQLKGTTMESIGGKKFFSFRGIPYAEPPVQSLRFKPPVAKLPWEGILDATKDGQSCPQVDNISAKYLGDENCLYINVYTPTIIEASSKLPVMAFIHGGGFQFGTSESSFFGPQRYLDHNIILVTFNYRLGPLGFISTSDDAAKGNYGLLDQSLALKWVRQNILSFGGDPNHVTLFGESAGAASVGFHILSPLSKGLFHKAVMQSGSPLCRWSTKTNPLVWSKKIAKDFGCNTDDNIRMMDCLRTKPAKELVLKSTSYSSNPFLLPFAPVVDGLFLMDHPKNIVETGEVENIVPVISGINYKEGSLFFLDLQKTNPQNKTTDKDYVLNTIRYITDESGRITATTEMIYDYYYSKVDVKNEIQTNEALVKIISEGSFDICHYETLYYFTKLGMQTHSYQYDYRATFSFMDLLTKEKSSDVGHAAELFRQFKLMLPGVPTDSSDDLKLSDVLNVLWTNFAKTGNPTPETSTSTSPIWEKNSESTFNVYHINLTQFTVKYEKDQDETYKFWTSTIPESVRSTHENDEL